MGECITDPAGDETVTAREDGSKEEACGVEALSSSIGVSELPTSSG